MPNLTPTTTLLLPSLLAAGALGTWIFSFNNGTFPALTALIESSNPSLPSCSAADAGVPLKQSFTGVGPVDKQLTVLLGFFWHIVNGCNPAVSLQALHFAGQAAAVWVLVVVEGMRVGRRGRWMDSPSLIGLLMQNFAAAVTLPAYFLLHLLTSPTPGAKTPNRDTLRRALSVPETDVAVLPLSIVLGFFVPTILMALPAPTTWSHETQQSLIALWQIFPVLIALVHPVLRTLFNPLFTRPANRADKSASPMPHLRPIYTFALLTAVISHTATLGLSASTLLFPSLFNPALVPALHPTAVFLPLISGPGTVLAGGVPEGVLRFMQWDELVSATATVVWAGSLWARDARGKAGGLGVLVRAVGWGVLGGPGAAAVALVWERDECVLG